MKNFEVPKMTLQRLNSEEAIAASTPPCFEIYACEDCYCTSVTCDDGYVCEGLRCPILDTI